MSDHNPLRAAEREAMEMAKATAYPDRGHYAPDAYRADGFRDGWRARAAYEPAEERKDDMQIGRAHV